MKKDLKSQIAIAIDGFRLKAVNLANYNHIVTELINLQGLVLLHISYYALKAQGVIPIHFVFVNDGVFLAYIVIY